MLPPFKAEGMHQRIAGSFRPVGDADADQEQHEHAGEDRPALPLIADHAAEDVGERCTDREDRHHLDQVGDRVRVFERMRRVGVEEAAAIGAEHLDRQLRGNRADGNRLLGALERGGIDIGAHRLRHAEIDEHQRHDDAERQQDVEGGAGHIDPEIADRLAGCARKGADEGHGNRNAGGRRHEVLHRQPGHLRQIRHGAFAAVVLPVGVADEADGGVERKLGANCRHAGRIEGQHRLQPHQRIKHQHAAEVEGEQRDRIGRPVLLFPFAGAG
jgi:hypothetical protein